MRRSCSLLRLAVSLVGLVAGIMLSPPAAIAAEPLRVIVHYGWGPPMVEDLDGQRGFIFDLYRLIGEALGRPVAVHLTPRNRMLPDLMQGRADIFCPMARAWLPAASHADVTWSGPVYEATDVLVARPEVAQAFPGLNAAKGVVAAVLGYVHPTLDAAVAAGGIVRENVKTEEQILVGVAAGRSDYGVLDLMVFRHLYSKMTNLRDRLQPIMVLDVRPVECIMPATSDQSPTIMMALMELRRTGKLDQLSAHYNGPVPLPIPADPAPSDPANLPKAHSNLHPDSSPRGLLAPDPSRQVSAAAVQHKTAPRLVAGPR